MVSCSKSMYQTEVTYSLLISQSLSDMLNSYISSTITLRTKPSLYYSSNDNYYLSKTRLYNNLSSCSCCAFPFHGIPISPRCLYGLSQSTLIHLPTSRKLLLGRGDRLFRLPVNDVESGCCCSRRRRRERGCRRIRCMVWEEEEEEDKCGRFGLGEIDGTAEAMISLLSGEVDERFYGGGNFSGKLGLRGVRRDKGRRNVGEFFREEDKYVECDCSKRRLKGNREFGEVKLREEDKYVEADYLRQNSRKKLEAINVKSRKEGKYVGSDFLKRNLRGKFESVNAKSREEDKYVESDFLKTNSRGKVESVNVKSREEGTEGSWRGKNEGLRKDGSSCSSYYSALSADDGNESEVDVQVMHERIMKNSLSGNESKETRGGEGVWVENVRKQSKLYEDDVWEENEEVNLRGNKGTRSLFVAIGSDLDLRNEREKRSTDLSLRQLESRKQPLEKFPSVREIHQSGSETTFSSKQRFGGVSSSMELAVETKKHSRETGERVSEHAGTGRKTQQFTEISDIRDIEIEGESNSLTQFRGRDGNLTESTNLIQERREKYQPTVYSSSGQSESRTKSQQLIRTSNSHESDIRSNSTSQRLSEVRLDNKDDSSTLLLEADGGNSQSDQQVRGGTQSKKESQDFTNISVTEASNTAVATNAQKILASERVIHKGRMSEESQRPTKPSNSRESTSEKISSSQAPISFVQQTAQVRVNEPKESRSSSEVIMTPPQSQFVKRTSRGSARYQEPNRVQEVSRETSAIVSAASSTEESSPNFPLELDGGTRKDKIHVESSELMFPEDALGSVNRLEESSLQFVGEFADKLRHGESTSKLLEETTSSKTASVYNDDTYTQQDSSQQVTDDFQSHVHGSKRSSFGSGARGPSDEMWDVPGPSSQEPSRIEATGEVTASAGFTITRSSRSLWSVISDIVRMRWGTHSGTHKSSVNLGVKSSSNESMGSEAWFSGHETDERDVENFKKGKGGVEKVAISAAGVFLEKSAESQRDASDGIVPYNKVIQIEVDKSSSSSTAEGSSASKEKKFDGKDVKTGQGILSGISTSVSSSPLSTRGLIRSPPVIEEVPENIKAEASSSGLMEIAKPVKEGPSEASGTETKEGELKRRKLQRNKQVLHERFEEWEEAYRLESDQRKVDEMFMREALLEAKRAADTWEVPVGAVLVKHGKIIARGCNLVEELRDSTAHAEMICIREASNQLRTWRLAETTLYVTLEPCAMCAGAILQGRIDAVVWGAPNKLLGADGSWVRLFPGGAEGGGSSDLTNQPAGPIHPFHPKITIRRGILGTECAEVMQQFFQLRRKEKKPSSPPTSGLLLSTHPSKFISKLHDIFSIMFCM